MVNQENQTTEQNISKNSHHDVVDEHAVNSSQQDGTQSAGQEPVAESSSIKRGKSAKKKYEEKIQELESRLNELNDRYLRLFSDFDNYRKRTSKERAELIGMASEEIIKSLLPVIDDFERALSALDKNENSNTDITGIKLIYNKLIGILNKKGLTAIESKDQPFNTDFHEALSIVPAPTEEQKGKVIEEVEKGYMLNGKVIRFARVIVGQ